MLASNIELVRHMLIETLFILKSEEGITIQTNFERFSNSFSKHLDDNVYIGRVNYTDYENEIIPQGNIFNTFLHKRKAMNMKKKLEL